MADGFPSNRHQMKRMGYTFVCLKNCPKCGEQCEQWKTARGNQAPLFAKHKTASLTEETLTHWPDCKKTRNVTPTVSPEKDRERRAAELLQQSNARMVVCLYDDGFLAFSYRHGISPEDLRHELITAANHIRNQMVTKHV